MLNFKIREIIPDDYEFILRINEENVEVLSPMDEERLKFFIKTGAFLRVAEVDGELAGFIITLREGVAEYDSENYRWFSREYPEFLYVDRIVIDEPYRGISLGSHLYNEVFSEAKSMGVPVVTAEVDIVPYNEASLRFHEEMGFKEVGTQVIRGGMVEVSLQVREVQ